MNIGTQSLQNAVNTGTQSLNAVTQSLQNAVNAGTQNAVNTGTQSLNAVTQSLQNAVNAGTQMKTSLFNLDIEAKLNAAKESVKQFLPPTEEDEFRNNLLVLSTKPNFQQYFAQSVSNKLVSEFLKILSKLGEFSKKYSELLKKYSELLKKYSELLKINKYNEKEEDFFSEFFLDTPTEESNCLVQADDKYNLLTDDKYNLLTDEKIKKFLKDAMILYLGIIQADFTKLVKVVIECKKVHDPTALIKEILSYFEQPQYQNGGGNVDDYFYYEILLKILMQNKAEFSSCLRKKLSPSLNKVLEKLYTISGKPMKPIDIKYSDKSYANDNTNTEKIIEKMVCQIQKIDIDTEPLINIVKPILKKKIKKLNSIKNDKKINSMKNDKKLVEIQELVKEIQELVKEISEYIKIDFKEAKNTKKGGKKRNTRKKCCTKKQRK